MGVNPNRKSGVEPRRRLDGALCHLPATPAAALVPDVLANPFPLDIISNAERGNLSTGQPKFSIFFAQARSTLERTLQRIIGTTRGSGRNRLKLNPFGLGDGRLGPLSDGGRDHRVSLDSYRPPQAGQPPASKVLSRHSSPALLGA